MVGPLRGGNNRMNADRPALTEREKDALRLLLAGHEAKSIAQELDLSVHTVNDRLRNARAKLGVSSSREAARRWAQMDGEPPVSCLPENLAPTPETPAHKVLGIAPADADGPQASPPTTRRTRGHLLVWLAGGMIIMSLLIAVAALSSLAGGTAPPASPTESAPGAAPAPSAIDAASQTAAAAAARDWLALIDGGRWEESWQQAGILFRSQITSGRWTQQVQPVREPLGAVVSRQLVSTDAAGDLPGAPAGEYAVLQFRTEFANMQDTIETVTLARDETGWAVIGYFIKRA